MKYETQCALLIKGDRVVKGTVVDLDPTVAAAYGTDLIALDAIPVVEPEAVEEEKPLADMSNDELKAKAKSLKLKTSGSMADLRERITLKLEAGEVTEPEAVEEETI